MSDFYICAILFASVASVVAMGSEKISFTWYLKHITPLMLVGYLSGILVIFIEWCLFFP